MDKTVFNINPMDCSSEENLIRLKISGLQAVRQFDFDLPRRQLTVYHEGQRHAIETAIHELNLNATRLTTEMGDPNTVPEETSQRKLLLSVLFINFAFFIIGVTTGFVSQDWWWTASTRSRIPLSTN